MARVTIEDCKKYIPNRFELVILAAQRAKDLFLGMPSAIRKTRDKDSVLALREIAAGRIDCEKLRELVITKYIDPMKKIFSNNLKNNTNLAPNIEDIFKDLASAANDIAMTEDDYEGDIESLDDHRASNTSISDDYVEHDDDEDDDFDEVRVQIKHQEFEADVTFDDEEADD